MSKDALSNFVTTRELYTALAELECDILERIRELEKRIAERWELERHVAEKDALLLKERLQGMNEFREQLNKERANYVTKDALELTIKGITGEIRPLEDSRQRERGQNAVVANNKAMIAIIMSVISAAVAIVAVILKL